MSRDALVRAITATLPAAWSVLDALQKAGIEYCLLRGDLETGEGLRDLDLLAMRRDASRLGDTLGRLGFVERRRPPGPHKRVFVQYRAGALLCVDVHEEVVQNGLVYMDRDRVLARRRWRGGVPVLSNEDLVTHLVWHDLLRRPATRPETRRRIEALLAGALDRGYLDDHLGRFGLAGLFERAARAVTAEIEDAGERQRLRREFRRAVCRARPGNRIGVLRFRLSRWRGRRRGGVVALVGPDGAGKSTLVAALGRRAAGLRSLRVESVYLGPWGQLELPLVKHLRKAGVTPSLEPWGRWLGSRLGRSGAGATPGAPAALPTRALLGKWLRSLVKGAAFYTALHVELLYRYATRVRPQVRRGRWVVSDRYVTDLRYLYKGRPIRNHALMRYLVCRLFPRPDLFVLLDNTAAVIHSRKPDLGVEAIDASRVLYRRAVERAPHLLLETDRQAEELADAVLDRIVRLDAAR